MGNVAWIKLHYGHWTSDLLEISEWQHFLFWYVDILLRSADGNVVVAVSIVLWMVDRQWSRWVGRSRRGFMPLVLLQHSPCSTRHHHSLINLTFMCLLPATFCLSPVNASDVSVFNIQLAMHPICPATAYEHLLVLVLLICWHASCHACQTVAATEDFLIQDHVCEMCVLRYDTLFALKNWQASWQFNLAHELKEN